MGNGGPFKAYLFLPVPKLTAKAQAEMDKYQDWQKKGFEYRDDSAACWPLGMPRVMTRYWPIQIVQLPTEVLLISMFTNNIRWIYTDGRQHPAPDDLIYSYNGHSIGHWEGKTLVVEGFLQKTDFNPLHAKREFIIAASDFGAFVMARPIMDMLLQQAPGISMHLVHIERDLTQKMASRAIDFAILPRLALDSWAVGPIQAESVVRITQVALMRKGHPLTALETISKADILKYRAVVFQPDVTLPDARKFIDYTGGNDVEVAARVGQMLLVPRLITGTDFVAVVPKALSEEVSAWLELESRPLSYLPPGEDFVLAWSSVQDNDPAHNWFRTALVSHMAALK